MTCCCGKPERPADQKRNESKWAVASFLCGILVWQIAIWGLMITGLSGLRQSFVPKMDDAIGTYFVVVVIYGTIALSVIALITGVVGWVLVMTKKSVLKGRWKAVAGISLGGWYLFLILALLVVPVERKARWQIHRATCVRNLHSFGKAISIYADAHEGRYPMPDKWCDFLVQGGYVTEDQFVCPGGPKARSHYAINPNTGTDSRPDMVLLFETKGGWNMSGGAELLSTDNHNTYGRDDCHVLLNDGRTIAPWRLDDGRVIIRLGEQSFELVWSESQEPTTDEGR